MEVADAVGSLLLMLLGSYSSFFFSSLFCRMQHDFPNAKDATIWMWIHIIFIVRVRDILLPIRTADNSKSYYSSRNHHAVLLFAAASRVGLGMRDPLCDNHSLFFFILFFCCTAMGMCVALYTLYGVWTVETMKIWMCFMWDIELGGFRLAFDGRKITDKPYFIEICFGRS